MARSKTAMAYTFVLIPGLLSDRRVWQPLAEIASGVPVHHANTTLDDTIKAMASRALAETSGALVVVGHSMGGRIAMEVAHQAPDRVRALVLANTGHNPLQPGESEKRQQKVDQGHRNFAAMIAEWLPPMMAASRHKDTALIRDLSEMAMMIGAECHERQIRALITRPNATLYLPWIRCPILLLTGTEDVWSPESQHHEMLNLAPNAELCVVENAGHFLPIEQPKETTRLILNWIAAKKEEING